MTTGYRHHTMKHGISLIESLVVLSIFSIVAVVSLGMFRGERNDAEIQDAAASMRNAFERARSGAATGRGSTDHGVHIREDKVVTFEGDVYVEGEGREMPFPASVSTDQASTTIIFDRISAASSASTTITLTHTSGATSTVTVTNDGIISQE